MNNRLNLPIAEADFEVNINISVAGRQKRYRHDAGTLRSGVETFDTLSDFQ